MHFMINCLSKAFMKHNASIVESCKGGKSSITQGSNI